MTLEQIISKEKCSEMEISVKEVNWGAPLNPHVWAQGRGQDWSGVEADSGLERTFRGLVARGPELSITSVSLWMQTVPGTCNLRSSLGWSSCFQPGQFPVKWYVRPASYRTCSNSGSKAFAPGEHLSSVLAVHASSQLLWGSVNP